MRWAALAGAGHPVGRAAGDPSRVNWAVPVQVVNACRSSEAGSRRLVVGLVEAGSPTPAVHPGVRLVVAGCLPDSARSYQGLGFAPAGSPTVERVARLLVATRGVAAGWDTGRCWRVAPGCRQAASARAAPRQAGLDQVGNRSAGAGTARVEKAPASCRPARPAGPDRRQPSNGQLPDRQPSNQELPDRYPSNQKGPNRQPTNQQLPGRRPSEQKGPNQQPSNQPHPGQRPSEQKGPDRQPSNQQLPGRRPLEQKGPDRRFSKERPSGRRWFPRRRGASVESGRAVVCGGCFGRGRSR